MTRKEIKIIDGLWSMAIKERDGGKCMKCGKVTYLNSHHIISRTVTLLRYSFTNGICLCSGCHTLSPDSAHQNPFVFRFLLKKLNIPVDALALLGEVAKKKTIKLDIMNILDYLEFQAKRIGLNNILIEIEKRRAILQKPMKIKAKIKIKEGSPIKIKKLKSPDLKSKYPFLIESPEER